MPYFGFPSQACQTCRKRKIKCDLAQPSCGQCVKSGWRCPGSRSVTELAFRDETSKVTERAQSDKPIVPARRSGLNGSRSKKDECEVIDYGEGVQTSLNATAAVPSPRPSPSPNLDDLALTFFLCRLTVTPRPSLETWKELQKAPWLHASVLALGAAAATDSRPGSYTSNQIQTRYVEAIRLTNEALRSPDHVKTDSALLAVNLLGIFEAIDGSRLTFEPWHNHIKGATALLQHRGPAQFESAEGGRLFLQTTIMLVTSCITRRFPIPEHVYTLAAAAADYVPDPENYNWRSFCLTLRFGRLYTRLLPHNMPRSAEDAKSVVLEALALDLDILALTSGSSDEWHPIKIPSKDTTASAGYVNAFRYVFAAQQYNSLASKRIILQDIMVKALSCRPDAVNALDLPTHAIQYIQNASQTISHLQSEIFASVPQHLGTSCSDYIHFPSVFPDSPLLQTCARDPIWPSFFIKDHNPWQSKPNRNPSLPCLRMNGGFTLQWPLYIAGRADAMDGKVRLGAITLLRVLGSEMRLRQATLLGRSLELGTGEQLNAHIEFGKEMGGD